MKSIQKQSIVNRRKSRVRGKIKGIKKRVRVSARASLSGIFVQFIDDDKGVTILSSRDNGFKGTKVERAAELGKKIGKEAVDKGIKDVVFDRGSKKYHGRVKALADALREAGLKL
ncbi:50S ribosomal protein L18 [Patescibacteria group bacterium]|nr:50S ribosomal protein L18 [Patescibacteria group bacterium]